MTKNAKAIHPHERAADEKLLKRAQYRCEGKVARTATVVAVWRTRWKTAKASCSCLLPFLPAFPKSVMVKVSPSTPCIRLPEVTSGRNHLRKIRMTRGTRRTRGTEKEAA